MTLNSAIRLTLYIASAFGGLWWGGSHGLIVGIAAHSWACTWWMPRSNGDTGSGFRHSMRWGWVSAAVVLMGSGGKGLLVSAMQQATSRHVCC
jgi:hypothetical protein